MTIWPFEQCQSVPIPAIISHESSEQEGVNEEAILQTKAIPLTGLFVILTTSRVLLYNFNPMCLIASHQRSKSSIDSLGQNLSLVVHIDHEKVVDGVKGIPDIGSAGVQYNAKIYFYVVTEKDHVLVYEILASENPFLTAKEYGILQCSSLRYYTKVGEALLSEDSNGDDVLKVTSKQDHRKVIQNGFTIDKMRGFFQFLNQDSGLDEMPIKKAEVHLKLILKFDHSIKDVKVLNYKQGSDEDNAQEKYFVILFDHGLQILHLVDFKLVANKLITLEHGYIVELVDSTFFVLSRPSSCKVAVSEIDVAARQDFESEHEGPLLNTFSSKGMILLAYEDEIAYYDVKMKRLIKRLALEGRLKLFKQLHEELYILLTVDNNLRILTFWGNVLFSYAFNDRLIFKDALYHGRSLILITASNELISWRMWEELPVPIMCNSTNTPLFLQSQSNEILMHFPMSKSPVGQRLFQVLHLPTKSTNNYVPLIRLNEAEGTLAIYVANKNILLLHSLRLNYWLTYPNVILLDCHWVGNHHLLCHVISSNRSESLQCFYFPIKNDSSEDVDEHCIWKAAIPSEMVVDLMCVNTTTVSKSGAMEDEEHELLRTGEVLLIYNKCAIAAFDILSVSSSAQGNVFKKLKPAKKHKLPTNSLRSVTWLVSVSDGFLALRNHTLIKIQKANDDEYLVTPLLDRIEKIMDYIGGLVFLIVENDFVIYKVSDLWEGKSHTVRTPIQLEEYPAAVNNSCATIDNIHYTNKAHATRLGLNQQIFLDQLIAKLCDDSVPAQEIHRQYSSTRYYKFALEKLLSTKVLNNEPLEQLLELLTLYEQGFSDPSAKLQIVSNCLRKIETKHWPYLFANLHLTPKDLLEECTKRGEAKLFGVLLMVFLNYDSTSKFVLTREPESTTHSTSTTENQPTPSIAATLEHEELMQRVLHILISSASSSPSPTEAQEYWEMALQLVRFITALDEQNGSTLITRLLEPI